MNTPQTPEVRYVPHQETRAPSSTSASIWLILTMAVVIPGVLSYILSTNSPLASIAIFVFLLVSIAIVVQPYIGMMLFLGLVYIRPEELNPDLEGMRLTLMIAAATLVATWFRLFVRREKVVHTPLIWCVIGVGILAPMLLAGRGDLAECIRKLWMIVAVVLMFVNLVRTPKQFNFVITLFIALTTYLACSSIYLASVGGAYIDKQENAERIMSNGSIFNDPNDLASVLVVGLALCTMRVLIARKWYTKIPYAFFGFINLYAILSTGSRGGMIALLVVSMGTFITYTKKPLLAVVLAAVCYAGFTKLGPSRMTDFDTTDYSAVHRLRFWNSGLEELKVHPLHGCGFDNYKSINDGRPPHNTFAQAFAELGYPGYFCWMGMIYYAYRKRTSAVPEWIPSARDERELKGVRLALSGLLAASFWLSRAYIPILYIVCLLPIMKQVTASGNVNVARVNSKEFFRDFLYINAWCIFSIAFIWWMVLKYG